MRERERERIRQKDRQTDRQIDRQAEVLHQYIYLSFDFIVTTLFTYIFLPFFRSDNIRLGAYIIR